MARMKLQVEGLDKLLERLKDLNVSIKEVSEEALKETHRIVTDKAVSEMVKHNQTGETQASIRLQPKINWSGTTASVSVGFDIANGGLPSIYLMYGTPKMKKDQKLYNAFYGKQTQKEIVEKQTDIFYEAIRRGESK